MELKLILIVVYIVLDIANAAVIEPIIQIDQGQLKGKIGESRGGKSFAEYLGIPYCQKPERFHVSKIIHRHNTKTTYYSTNHRNKYLIILLNKINCLGRNITSPEMGGITRRNKIWPSLSSI